MNLALAIFAAKFGDLLHEAQTDLNDDDLETLLVLVSTVIARLVADRIEHRWMEDR